MNITIIDGSQDVSHEKFQKELNKTVNALSNDNKVDLFTIKDMNMSYCCGCFSCWVKSPGECIYKDDGVDILKSVIKTDYLIIASPVIAGFISSDTKKAMDRLIPINQPYIKIYGGESHHVPRYDKRCNLGLIMFDDGNLDDEAVKLNNDTMDRFAKNFHSKKVYKKTAKASEIMEVITNEISSC